MKITLIFLAILPSMALADTTANNGVPQPTAELKTMTERLNLSQAQQDEIAPILVTESNKRQAIQDDSTLTAQQKHEQSGAVHRAALQQIKAYFTPDQMALIEQSMKHPQDGPTHPSTTSTGAN